MAVAAAAAAPRRDRDRTPGSGAALPSPSSAFSSSSGAAVLDFCLADAFPFAGFADALAPLPRDARLAGGSESASWSSSSFFPSSSPLSAAASSASFAVSSMWSKTNVLSSSSLHRRHCQRQRPRLPLLYLPCGQKQTFYLLLHLR